MIIKEFLNTEIFRSTANIFFNNLYPYHILFHYVKEHNKHLLEWQQHEGQTPWR